MNKQKTKDGLLRYLASETPEAAANPILSLFLDGEPVKT